MGVVAPGGYLIIISHYYISLLYLIIISHYYISLYLIIISHYYISYSNVNEISYFKNIANPIPKKSFALYPEDGFIMKSKHVGNIIF